MKITALVENQSNSQLKAKHGLSLYIETVNHKILFDLGPDKTLFENSNTLGLDLAKIDIVIISHGHIDHGGALKHFLEINKTAKIYIQKKAFEKHYAKILFFKVSVGIQTELQKHPQVVLVDGDYTIDDELYLFTVKDSKKCYSNVNDSLYTQKGRDDFSHEQSLIVFEDESALIMGCGHSGIVNIMARAAQYNPRFCVGGYHLYNPLTKRNVPNILLDCISSELIKYDTAFYTCHCTGEKAFKYLSNIMPNMHYLSCGECIKI